MPEETLFAFERRLDGPEIAAFLRQVADALEAGESMTIETGGDEVTLEPPARPTVEVEAERETDGGQPELSLEIELEWPEVGDDDSEAF